MQKLHLGRSPRVIEVREQDLTPGNQESNILTTAGKAPGAAMGLDF